MEILLNGSLGNQPVISSQFYRVSNFLSLYVFDFYSGVLKYKMFIGRNSHLDERPGVGSVDEGKGTYSSLLLLIK